MNMPNPTTSLFSGVRILSLAEQYPGPFATMLLADMGADVVLVERPGTGDPGRAFRPTFDAMARNKRSVCVDLKSEAGRADFIELVRDADVVLEGYRPGVMDRLGVGYSVLKEVAPRLIYASITGFGQSGPYRDRTAHDISYQAVAGLFFGKVGQGPIEASTLPFGDLSAAMFAALAVASALYGREHTGLGTAIDISMTDGLVSWMTPFLAPAMNADASKAVEPQPDFGPSEPAYGAFPCRDGRALTLSIAHEDHFWRALCAALNMPEHAALKGRQRVANCESLRRGIADRLVLQDLGHWQQLLDSHGIPWSPVQELEDVLADAHFVGRGLFTSVPTASGSTERHVLQPLKFSAYTTAITRAAPALGEHTAEVMAEARARSAAPLLRAG
ncbi:MAG: hypothetical protein JWQ90_3612 [Hydrocarboniphaga sp.]|uniref:CaiB/BaiF CoA transferase family protein n=1 Tax=Hydrocarboniphaga sp. TaxID=2033016 RepID=UPI0026113E87|nr:CaiB/BaiF CoA-transferase family protein [Hydrocarboniphaga sp.]MDB5971162.1 hypothetical protein [Hydrocarboniphaga sp.]